LQIITKHFEIVGIVEIGVQKGVYLSYGIKLKIKKIKKSLPNLVL
jgi:hypothetical protein